MIAEKPSGPGALSGWMENKASLTSRREGVAISFLFVVSEIQGNMAWRTSSAAGGFVDSKMLL